MDHAIHMNILGGMYISTVKDSIIQLYVGHYN